MASSRNHITQRAPWAQRIDDAMARTGVLRRAKPVDLLGVASSPATPAFTKDTRVWMRSNGFRPSGDLRKAIKTTRTRDGAPMTTTCALEASALGELAVLQFMLQNGGLGDVRRTNSEGRTPMFLAAQAGHLNVAMFLFQNGGAEDVRRRDNNGHSPLQAARSFGHRKVVRWLLGVVGEESRAEVADPTPMRDPHRRLKRPASERRARRQLQPPPPQPPPLSGTAALVAAASSPILDSRSLGSSFGAASTLTPSRAPPDLIAYLKQTFAEHDAHGTGALAWKELWWLLKSLGLGVTDAEVAKMQAQANRRGVDEHAPVTFRHFAPVAVQLLRGAFDARQWARAQADAEGHGGIKAWVRLFDATTHSFYLYNWATGDSEWVVPNDATQAMRVGTPLKVHRDARQAAALKRDQILYGSRL